MGMKYLIAICILLLTHLVYSQKDTITINQSDIEIVKKQKKIIFHYNKGLILLAFLATAISKKIF